MQTLAVPLVPYRCGPLTPPPALPFSLASDTQFCNVLNYQGNGLLMRYPSAVGLSTITGPDHRAASFCCNCNGSICCCSPQHQSLASPWNGSVASLLTPSGLLMSCPTRHDVPTDSEINVQLDQADLWSKFNAVGTEMILTKAGRRMFPTIDLAVTGLEMDAVYSMVLEIRRADENRYKYANSKWIAVGKSDAEFPDRIPSYLHPESPNTGSSWMKNAISFKKAKLANNTKNDKHIVLRSMHKYEPRFNIIRQSLSGGQSQLVFTKELTECSFIAVTSYQSNQMTQLKIDYNPFAKAFRDPISTASRYSKVFPSPPASLDLRQNGLQPAVATGPMASTWEMSAPSFQPTGSFHTTGMSYPSLYSDASKVNAIYSAPYIASGASGDVHMSFYPPSVQQSINTTGPQYGTVNSTHLYRPTPVYACPALGTWVSHPLPVFPTPADCSPYRV